MTEGKRLIWVFTIGISIILVIVFILLNNLLPKEQCVAYGNLLSERPYFNESDVNGTTVIKFYYFKLDNGNTVKVKAILQDAIQRTDHPRGAKAKIYYRKGLFLKNPIYDYCEFL